MDFQKVYRVCIYDSLKQIDNEGHVTPWCTLVDKETWCMGGNSPEFCLVHMAIVSRDAALAAQGKRISALEAELARVSKMLEKAEAELAELFGPPDVAPCI